MNFCGKVAAGLLLKSANNNKGNLRRNAIVSPLGFNIILNMMAEGIAGPMSGQMLNLLDLKKNGAHDRIPSRLEQMSRENEKQRMLRSKFEQMYREDKEKQRMLRSSLPRRRDIISPEIIARKQRSELRTRDISISSQEDQDPRSTVRSVTKALCDKTSPLPPNFHRLITQVYRGQVEQVDFINGNLCAIAADINSWAKSQTEGMLNSIITRNDLNASMELVLVNAVYFRGIWSASFLPHLTTDRRFQLLMDDTGGESSSYVYVPFMSGCMHYYHTSRIDDDFDVIRIPYGLPCMMDAEYRYSGGDDDASMYMFVPTEINKFQTILHKISSGALDLSQDFDDDQLKGRDSIWIPKFNIGYHTADLPSVLADYSFTKTPDREQQAYHGCNISHHSAIIVDEYGTVAASGTCLTKPIGPAPGEKKEIVVDKPFVFMIRDDKSKLIIFLGMVLDPSLSPCEQWTEIVGGSGHRLAAVVTSDYRLG